MTSTVTVYRVAHAHFINPTSGTHFGPYATDGMPEDSPRPYIDSGISTHHPAPFMDGLGHLHDSEVCGFESLDAYTEWFDDYSDDLDELHDCNFHLQIWEIPSQHVRFGNKQVAFTPSQGRIVDTMRL